jgi:UMF1 family MFS transporter
MAPFDRLIVTFVFSVYFARAVVGDPVAGTALWSRALTLSGLAVAVLSPALGAIADRGGRLKPWLGVFTAVTVAASAALWMVRPDPADTVPALIGVGIAGAAYELATLFYNAFLPGLAPQGRLGRVSGIGWGCGYIGGIVCLGLALALLVMPAQPLFGLLDTGAGRNIRATALLTALWYGLFCLPLFLLVPERPKTAPAPGGGLAALGRTLETLRHDRRLLRFLIGSALYRDGLATLFAFGGLYAAGTFGMGFQEILVFAIALNLTAGLGAIGFGLIEDRIGSRRCLSIALAGLIGFGVPLLLAGGRTGFWIFALGLGLFVGPAQSAGRSLMALMAPPGRAAEMFGLYGLSGKASAFLGPLVLGWATTRFHSQRAGMATILLFFAAGFILVRRSDPESGV